jgi:hypothetical protein
VPLIVAASAAALVPRFGAVAHAALLVPAMLADQTRLQPEFISLTIVLIAAPWPRNGFHIVRWHLITLWFWAGFNKVLSSGWPQGPAPFLARAMGLGGFVTMVAVLIPLTEMGLGLAALRPKAWPVLRWAALIFHLGTVVVLARAGYNTSVWPWNLSLALVALLAFSRPESNRLGGLPYGRRGAILAASAAFLVLYPVGFYFGVVDAYPAHNLYTSNTTLAFACSRGGERRPCRSLVLAGSDELNVLLPPESRLFDALFDRTCRPGDILVTHGKRLRFTEPAPPTVRPCPG